MNKHKIFNLKNISILLSFLAILLTAYLTYIHYYDLTPFCLSGGGCEKVQNSQQSYFLEIPVALIGLIGYIIIFFNLLFNKYYKYTANLFLTFTGLAFSLYLNYQSYFVIKAVCNWCQISFLLIILLTILAIILYFKNDE